MIKTPYLHPKRFPYIYSYLPQELTSKNNTKTLNNVKTIFNILYGTILIHNLYNL